MTDKELAQINKHLKRYGIVTDGRQRYRLVHNVNLTERRYGEFNLFYGDIFLRTEESVQETPKYPMIKPGNYILEKLVYRPAMKEYLNIPSLEYECIASFKHKLQEKSLALRFCDQIITALDLQAKNEDPEEAAKHAVEKTTARYEDPGPTNEVRQPDHRYDEYSGRGFEDFLTQWDKQPVNPVSVEIVKKEE